MKASKDKLSDKKQEELMRIFTDLHKLLNKMFRGSQRFKEKL